MRGFSRLILVAKSEAPKLLNRVFMSHNVYNSVETYHGVKIFVLHLSCLR